MPCVYDSVAVTTTLHIAFAVPLLLVSGYARHALRKHRGGVKIQGCRLTIENSLSHPYALQILLAPLPPLGCKRETG